MLNFVIRDFIVSNLSLIHISEATRPLYISYAVFCLKKKMRVTYIKEEVGEEWSIWFLWLGGGGGGGGGGSKLCSQDLLVKMKSE